MGLEIGGILGLIVLALNIFAIVKTLQSPLPDTTKILWVVVILLLPVIGLILWFLMSKVR